MSDMLAISNPRAEHQLESRLTNQRMTDFLNVLNVLVREYFDDALIKEVVMQRDVYALSIAAENHESALLTVVRWQIGSSSPERDA